MLKFARKMLFCGIIFATVLLFSVVKTNWTNDLKAKAHAALSDIAELAEKYFIPNEEQKEAIPVIIEKAETVGERIDEDILDEINSKRDYYNR